MCSWQCRGARERKGKLWHSWGSNRFPSIEVKQQGSDIILLWTLANIFHFANNTSNTFPCCAVCMCIRWCLPLLPAFVKNTRIKWLYKRGEVSFEERWATVRGDILKGLGDIPVLFTLIFCTSPNHTHACMCVHTPTHTSPWSSTRQVLTQEPLSFPLICLNYAIFTATTVNSPAATQINLWLLLFKYQILKKVLYFHITKHEHKYGNTHWQVFPCTDS